MARRGTVCRPGIVDASPDADAAPASTPVTSARRRSTEALRGLRFGALVIAVITGVWAWQQAGHYYHVLAGGLFMGVWGIVDTRVWRVGVRTACS